MTGCSSRCIEDRILPLYGAHASHERFNLCRPLPHGVGSPDLEVLSVSLTSTRSSDRPRLIGLSGPTSLRLNRMDLPCSHQSLWLHAGGTNPGSTARRSLCRGVQFRLPLSGIGSATPITIDFGAIFPFTDVPAYNLPVYASQRPVTGSPRKTWYAAAS